MSGTDKLARTVRAADVEDRRSRPAHGDRSGPMALHAGDAAVAPRTLRRGDEDPRAPMRILFFGRRFTYFRNFDSVLRELASRGHVIHLAVERETDEGRPLVDGLIAEYPNISVGVAPGRAPDDWSWVASRLRHGLEYLRYQHRLFDDTPMLRERSRERTPGLFVALADAVGRYARWTRRPVEAVLGGSSDRRRTIPAVRAFVEEQRPDVVLVTPLISLGSSQIDYLRAARALGIPTALCVWSWDHLSSKALIRELPDRVFVWNDTQKQEATRSPRRARRADCRDRGPVLRQVVRPRTLARSRDVLPSDRPARGPADPALRVLGAVHRQPARSAVRGRVDSAHPDAAARPGCATRRSSSGLIRPGVPSGRASI